MKILLVGSGGREHAMAWKLAQSPRVSRVYVAPGNGGTQLDHDLLNVPITDLQQLRNWALQEHIDLTVVGPEAPLAAGIVDDFRAHGLRIFGPTQAAAQLESSKAFSKDFMRRHGLPTAAHEVFDDVQAAHDWVQQRGAPIVIKADGLAAGKGVVVALTLEEAHAAVEQMFALAGARVVIEDFLLGEEASFIVLCDGRDVVPLASSQDHKRLQDGDLGPNTGGMGAYSPAPVVTPEVHARIMREVILPAVRGMREDGIPFTGFLYAGLMIDEQGQVQLLEFNARMGDPETQPILMRLKSDWAELLLAACQEGGLAKVRLDWDRRTALGVVLAASGYPQAPRKGDLIRGVPEADEDLRVFHAGTQLDDHDGLKTSGGRVMCVTALADSPRQAQKRAYAAIEGIHFDGMQYRRDIGFRAVKPWEAA